MTADAMVAVAFTAPHVTEWVTVDVTRTMKLVERLRADREFAASRSPRCSSSRRRCCSPSGATPDQRDLGRGGRRDRRQALRQPRHRRRDPRGLVVPNIKDADRMSLRELADALAAAHGDGSRRQDPAGRHERRHDHDHERRRLRRRRGTPILNPARRPSSRSGRSGGSRGCTRAG
jgi:pyruvate dehydrogenase E2 component (dihydrolipoamide acetyltransferase)